MLHGQFVVHKNLGPVGLLRIEQLRERSETICFQSGKTRELDFHVCCTCKQYCFLHLCDSFKDIFNEFSWKMPCIYYVPDVWKPQLLLRAKDRNHIFFLLAFDMSFSYFRAYCSKLM